MLYDCRVVELALPIEGYMKPGELEFLDATARSLHTGSVVVEVGSWKGRSTVVLCEAARATGSTVWAVDSFSGDAELRDVHGTIDRDVVRAEFDRNTAGYSDCLRVLESDSVAAAEHFEDASVDWVFIDADHSCSAVLADIAAWAPKVKAGGLISGHDYGRSGVTDAVRRRFGRFDVSGSIWYTRERPGFQLVPSLRIALRRLLRGG